MTIAARLPRLRPRWLPWSLSLAGHGLVAALLWLHPSWTATPGRVDQVVIDTRVSEPERDIQAVLYDQPPRPALPIPLPPPPVPAPPLQPKESEPGPASERPAAPHAPGPEQASQTAAAEPPLRSDNPVPAGGSSAGLGAGRPLPSFFQIPAQAHTIVYVIDRSASMGLDGGLAAAKRELLTSLEQLPAEARFQVIFYNRHAESLPVTGAAGLLEATAASKRYVAAYLDSIIAEGGTDHLPALKRALAYRPEVIFFLTDANDLPDEQVRAVTVQNRGRVCIHTVEMVTSKHEEDDQPLEVLARNNRGIYRAVSIADGAP